MGNIVAHHKFDRQKAKIPIEESRLSPKSFFDLGLFLCTLGWRNVIHNLVSHYGETADMVQCTLAEEIEPLCDIIPPQSLDQDNPLATAEVAKTSPKTILPLWQIWKRWINWEWIPV